VATLKFAGCKKQKRKAAEITGSFGEQLTNIRTGFRSWLEKLHLDPPEFEAPNGIDAGLETWGAVNRRLMERVLLPARIIFPEFSFFRGRLVLLRGAHHRTSAFICQMKIL